MLLLTPIKVIKEGELLLSDLRANQINSHIKLISDKTLIQKVKSFFEDSARVFKKIDTEIAYITSLVDPAYRARLGDLYDLRSGKKTLMKVQDEILELVGQR